MNQWVDLLTVPETAECSWSLPLFLRLFKLQFVIVLIYQEGFGAIYFDGLFCTFMGNAAKRENEG